jgi:dihydrodipicolinate synthase/N-acetylneuraminate lyase
VELRSFQGVISACLTPNGRYRERIPELVDFHLKHGVRGFFVLGTTGESVKLSREERLRWLRRLSSMWVRGVL